MNTKWTVKFTALAVLLLAGASAARADDVYTITVRKQDDKAKNRWSLQDWLETRDKIRLMDLWLALHSPSPYEFFIDGEYRFSDGTPGMPFSNWKTSFGAYASIFGIEGGRLFADRAETPLLFCLRIFGFHEQATNITLQGGTILASDGAGFQNGVLGVHTTIYLNRMAGLEGSFHHLFPSTPNDAGIDRQGNRLAGGAFIDFRELRVYAEYLTSTEAQYQPGFGTGLRFFF
jgi:hypothetical protein